MKFALLIYTDSTLLDALPPDQFDTKMRGCFEHVDELSRKGRFYEAQMLETPVSAKSVRIRSRQLSVVDGPFTETKELLAGFNLIEADSMEEAVRIAAKFPWAEFGCVEVREVKDINAERERVSRSPEVAESR
jgi:hypothetical protein